MLLAILFFAVAAICFYLGIKNPKWGSRCFYLVIVCIVISIVSGCVACDDGPSKWDKLTKEEKEWYNNNYGSGQYNDYKGAIDDYYN